MKLAQRTLFASVALAFVVAAANGADKAKAEQKLNAALKAQDSAKVTEACDELLGLGGPEALKVLLSKVDKTEGQIYWQLVGAASGFKDRPALEELGKFIVSAQSGAKLGLSRDLVFGLQNNTSGYAAVPLGIVLEKGKYDLQLMAVDQLAVTRSTDSIDALVAAFKKEAKGDAQLRDRIEKALISLTGQNLGDPGNWEGWWKEQRSKGVPEKPAGEGGAGGTLEKPRDKEINTTVEKGSKGRVIVLACIGDDEADKKAEPNDFDYDHMQDVLKEIKIPYTLVKRKSFELDPKKWLKDCYALLINCHQMNKQCVCEGCQPPEGDLTNRMMHCNHKCSTHIEKTYAINQGGLEAIKAWVENDGGFLYTEDWGIVETLQKLWPGKVTTGGNGDQTRTIRKQKEDKSGWEKTIPVKLVPSPGSTSNPLLRGVWQAPRKNEAKPDPAESGGSREKSPAKPLEHTWQVDDESPAIEIVDKANVIPLLESPEVGKLTEGRPVVAVTFRVGNAAGKPKQATGPGGKDKGSGEWSLSSKGGRVLHTLSHFGHQGTGSEDGQALYNMLLNFLLEAAKRHEGESAKK